VHEPADAVSVFQRSSQRFTTTGPARGPTTDRQRAPGGIPFVTPRYTDERATDLGRRQPLLLAAAEEGGVAAGSRCAADDGKDAGVFAAATDQGVPLGP
jgi:hypothetical protein